MSEQAEWAQTRMGYYHLLRYRGPVWRLTLCGVRIRSANIRECRTEPGEPVCPRCRPLLAAEAEPRS